MLFENPGFDRLYDALLARDAAFDGRYFVGVKSTGVFCRLTCPARKPRPENCEFYDSVADCFSAGFRPCKRCTPMEAAGAGDPIVQDLLAALRSDPTRRWCENDLVSRGLDPSTVRRAFKRYFGATFLEIARMQRIGAGFAALSGGERVIDAQVDAGFASANGFRVAFAKLLGATPDSFTGDEKLKADWIETPLGSMLSVADDNHVHLLEFVDRKALPSELKRLRKNNGPIGVGATEPGDRLARELDRFFRGAQPEFQTPIAMHGTDFSRKVWRVLRQIPAGQTCSYKDIAAALGKPTAIRAVARANGANQIAIVIPCHRVIGADGSLTGYGGGLWRKQKLIEIEKSYL